VKGGNLAHLQAKSYTIEDKLKDDDRRWADFEKKFVFFFQAMAGFDLTTHVSSVLSGMRRRHYQTTPPGIYS
jgi:hypothetical protein